MNRVWLGMVVGAGVLGVAAFGGGCGNTGVEFGTGGGHGGHAATSSSSSSGDVTTSSSSSASGAGSSSSGASSSSSSSGASSSSGGGCTLDAKDDACVKCTKATCCAELVPCQNDAACVCWTGCLSQNPNNPAACAGCGPYDNTTSTFVNCASAHCLNECGGSTTSSSSSSGGGLCAPAAGDSACTACAKMKCCSQVNACAGSNNCICWTSCLAQGGSIQACFGACGAPDNTTNQLSNCSLQQCPGTCP